MRRLVQLVDDPATAEARVLDGMCRDWQARLMGEMPASVHAERSTAAGFELDRLALLQGWRRLS